MRYVCWSLFLVAGCAGCCSFSKSGLKIILCRQTTPWGKMWTFFCYKVDGSEWKTREVQILLSKDWQDPPLKNRDLIRSTRRRLIAAKRNWDKTSNKKEWEQNIKSSRKFGVTLLVNQRVPSQTLFFYPKPTQKGVAQFRPLLGNMTKLLLSKW